MVFTETQKQSINNFEREVTDAIQNAWNTSKREATILYQTIENKANVVVDHLTNFFDKDGHYTNNTNNTDNSDNNPNMEMIECMRCMRCMRCMETNHHHSINIQCIRHLMVINELKKIQMDKEWETINII